MDFNLAVKFKNKQLPFELDGLIYIWMVVPELQKDINKWRNDYLKSTELFTDETAKRYSTNNSFAILYIIKK